jgi:hypothetical protein
MAKSSMYEEIMRDGRSTKTVPRITNTPNFCGGRYKYTDAQVYSMRMNNPDVQVFLCRCGSYHKVGG